MSAARAIRQAAVQSSAIPAGAAAGFVKSQGQARSRSQLMREIERMAGFQGTPLTLKELYEFGQRARASPTVTRMQSAQFLHAELPVRLAHRVRELTELPHGLALMPSVIAVRDMYERSFSDLVMTRLPRDVTDERNFAAMLTEIRRRHEDVVRLMAKGVIELKEHCGKGGCDLEIRSFLDRFYMSRIGIRFLMSHHLSLAVGEPRMAGAINTHCKPADLIREAVNISRGLSYQHYGEAADVQIYGNTHLEFPYVESHLLLCLLELLKNSLRATVETHRDEDCLPPVRVIIADGVEDVTIKISDEGGGFRRSELGRVWSYLFTTARLPAKDLLAMEDRRCRSNRPDPIAGFGYGLPLSRLYARYWGGELGLTSMEGYGTDAYLHLSKLGDKKECLFT